MEKCWVDFFSSVLGYVIKLGKLTPPPLPHLDFFGLFMWSTDISAMEVVVRRSSDVEHSV